MSTQDIDPIYPGQKRAQPKLVIRRCPPNCRFNSAAQQAHQKTRISPGQLEVNSEKLSGKLNYGGNGKFKATVEEIVAKRERIKNEGATILIEDLCVLNRLQRLNS